MNTRPVFFNNFNSLFYRIACFSCKLSPTGEHSNFNLFPTHDAKNTHPHPPSHTHTQDDGEAGAFQSIFAVPPQELSSRTGPMVGSAPRSETPAFCFTAAVSVLLLLLLFFTFWAQTSLSLRQTLSFASGHVLHCLVASRLLGNGHVDGCLALFLTPALGVDILVMVITEASLKPANIKHWYLVRQYDI